MAKRFGGSQQAVSKKAKKELWTQGKIVPLVEKKVSIVKSLYEIENESCELPTIFKTTFDDVVRERLENEYMLMRFDKALLLKGQALLTRVKSVGDWEMMTRGRRNLTPAQAKGTTVNISQQQAQAALAIKELSPRDALTDLLQMDAADSNSVLGVFDVTSVTDA